MFFGLLRNPAMSKERKSKLIEIMLIVGTLTSTLGGKQPDGIILLFVLFSFLSVLYYIILHNTEKISLDGPWTGLLSWSIGIIFSGLLSVRLLLSQISSSTVPVIILIGLAGIYYIVFSIIISNALKNETPGKKGDI